MRSRFSSISSIVPLSLSQLWKVRVLMQVTGILASEFILFS
jgi:hypothetical protein